MSAAERDSKCRLKKVVLINDWPFHTFVESRFDVCEGKSH